MRLTYYGHASFLLETGGKRIIFDPFISPNEAASHIEVDQICCDFMVLTHAHGDHVADVERIAERNPDMMLISNFEIVSYYGSKGIKGHGMNHGGKRHFGFGNLKLVNAVHSSSFPDGTYGGNPAGVVIWNEEACIYIAGDTGLTKDMELIPRTCPELSAAVLPIGDNFTMGYEEASLAAEMVRCDKVIACHFDTFPPITVDHAEVSDHFTKAGQNITLPEIGQTIEI